MADRPLRAFLADDDGTSTVEYVMVAGMVALPLLLLYGVFWRALVAEYGFVAWLLSQPAP